MCTRNPLPLQPAIAEVSRHSDALTASPARAHSQLSTKALKDSSSGFQHKCTIWVAALSICSQGEWEGGRQRRRGLGNSTEHSSHHPNAQFAIGTHRPTLLHVDFLAIQCKRGPRSGPLPRSSRRPTVVSSQAPGAVPKSSSLPVHETTAGALPVYAGAGPMLGCVRVA